MAPSDERLVYETLQGNLSAFEELVHRYERQVFTIAYRMTNQREEAEDVAQEVFINVYRKLYQFDTSRRFAPWIQKIAVNTCITRLRKKKKVISVSFDDSLNNRSEVFPNIDYSDPSVVYDRQQLREDINEALLQLPESYRAMLILRYQLEMSNQEIAEALGITRENVEVRIHRARKSLRKVLLERRDERGKLDELSAGR